MKKLNNILLLICLLFWASGTILQAQPISKNEEIKQYDREFKEELKKKWTNIYLQNTGDRSTELGGRIIEDHLVIGILPKNEEIKAYDRLFAEELRSGEWREVNFSKTDSFDMEKPSFPDIIDDFSSEGFASIKDGSGYKPKIRPEKLRIPTDFKQKYRECVGEVASTDNIKFYGYEFPIYYDHKVKNYPLNSPMDIGNFWEALSESEWGIFVKQIEEYATALGLEFNDWGYALLINKIGRNIYLHNNNASTLFTCFMLNHSGLHSKMTYDNDLNLNLLLVTNDKILNTLYEYDEFNYYYYNFKTPSIKNIGRTTTPSVNFEPPNMSMKPIASFVQRMPKLLDNANYYNHKTFSFYTKGNIETVTGNVNLNRLKYYKDIPPTTLEVYFEASCFIQYNDKLVHDLASLVAKRKTYDEKINLLLDFTSANNSFEYDADCQTLFPEETLANAKSDCEDRAILFAALAERILNIKVLGIKYKEPKDHVIIAVPHKSQIPLNDLEYTEYSGTKYVLCDPTAEGAIYGKVAKGREYQPYDRFDFPTRCSD
ncbi:MAG: hypothetical protein ACPGVB_14230 [Chitinophagales bacterium]